MGRIGLFVLFCLIPLVSYSQEEIDTRWKSELDFRNDEDNIVNKILWLEENPIATPTNDTKEISNYVLDWITGAPHVEVVLESLFTSEVENDKRYKYSDKIKVTYLFGKSVYHIQNPDDPDPVKASFRGLEGVVKVYQEILDYDHKAKHQLLERYSYLYETNRLFDFIFEEYEELGI